MRIFVTGTGRCGSVTFSRACRHITNYTVGHETHTNKRDAGRMVGDILNLDYPDDHIEVSPQLAIQIPLLRDRYPHAKWVHLIRTDRDACARSLLHRSDMRAFARYNFLSEGDDGQAVAYAIYDTMRTVVDACLDPDRLTIATAPGLVIPAIALHLETIKREWRGFWDWAGAEGDFDASLAEWDRRYNKGIYQ